MRIALAQINTVVGDLAGNRDKILAGIKQARGAQADIVTFPEMAITGYPPEDLLFKEHFVKDNLAMLQSIAQKAQDITVVVGCADYDPKRKHLFNAAAVLRQGKIWGIYHKRNLPNYGVFDEKRYFKEGNNCPVFSLGGVAFGVNICEDVWVDGGICKEQIKKGAQILINISSSPFEVNKFETRKKILRRWAKDNRVFVCYNNLVGGQDELVFDGGSLVFSAQGEVLARGKQLEEDFVVVDLEVKPSKSKRKGVSTIPGGIKKSATSAAAHFAAELPPIERIFKALVMGTRDYVRKNGFKKVLVGLSGGIDSALVSVVAREALGAANVVGITMPSRFSSEGTRSDARQMAENLGIQFLEIPIESIFKGYLDVLAKEFKGQAFNVAEENLQARIRGNILMAFSNKFGWLVLTTGNKSEIAVGYCTLYGDMSGGFAVIKDVPKAKVYELGLFLNKKFNGLIPQSIMDRPPTAELRHNQKDEDSLPPYPILDQILESYVEAHHSVTKLRKVNPNAALIRSVVSMVDRSEYKRRQAPPGIKITPRAFGRDWRLPITNRYNEK